MRLAVFAATAFAVSVVTYAIPATAAPSSPPLPGAAPEQAGFSVEGLARIDRFFDREIAAHQIPGAVVAIAREGKLVYYKAFGRLRPDGPDLMPLDAIFSIASMTKPMAAVGGLVLMEEGRLPMHSRLSDYFPEFAEMKVGTEEPGGAMALRPAASPVYIQDLYRHTAGMVYGARGHTPMHKLYPPSSAGAATTLTGAQFVEKLAAAPLLHDPGTYWDYSLSVDLLGLVIEHVAG